MVQKVESARQKACSSRFAPVWGRLVGVSGALAFSLALSAPAYALSGGEGAAPLEADSPWAGVGSLSVNGQLFTATLIAPGYVLTAAHVVNGASASSVVFQTASGESFSSVASAIYIDPTYTGGTAGNVAGDPTVHGDLAIIKLADATQDLSTYNIYTGDLYKQTISMVSFGGSSTQATTGANKVDLLFADASGEDQTYAFDRDGSDLSSNMIGADIPANGSLGNGVEAGIVHGDSGSAAFVYVNGEWQLAGINTFSLLFAGGSTTQGDVGTGGGGIVLASQMAWIQSVITAPVPEPESAWMLLAGLGLIGSLLRRRQRG